MTAPPFTPTAPFGRVTPRQPQALTGAREAILRSVFVAVLLAAVAALVSCVLPGHQIIYAMGADQAAIVRQAPAGSPLLALAMIAATLLAGLGVALPRRETTALAAGTLTFLALPLGIWQTLTQLDHPGMTDARVLWPAHLLELALPVVTFAGPVLAIIGWLLFRLEASARHPVLPAATLKPRTAKS